MFNLAPQVGDLMISVEHRSWVETSLDHMAGLEVPDDLAQSVDVDDENFWSPEYSWARPYTVRDGDLIIPVQGVLLHSFPYAFGKWATGYDYIVAAARRGASDPNVERIILHTNSPGGLVSGCFDAADAIYALREQKPLIALADETALSAAYALASATDEIVVARTGQVGSVGVMAAYTEFSRALDSAGITVNLVFAGDRKADGHPSQPLSEEARARAQTRLDQSYDLFVSTVARNRGMSEEAIRGTEADFFTSQEAVQNGLADTVGSLGTLSANAENSPEQEDVTMSNHNGTAAGQAAPQTTPVNPAPTNPAPAAAPDSVAASVHEAAVSRARTEGAEAERTRVAAIMDSDEAKARPKAARQVALKTNMDAEAGIGFLAGLDEEAEAKQPEPKAAGSQGFDSLMTATGNPNVSGEDTGNGGAPLTDAQVADGVFSSVGMAARK